MKDDTKPREAGKIKFEFSNPYAEKTEVIGCLLNGKPVPFVKLKHPEALQVARWQLIVKDLEFAEAQLAYVYKHFSTTIEKLRTGDAPPTFNQNDEKGLLIKSLFDSAMVAYGKCFAGAEGRKVKLEADKVFTGKKGKRLLKTHKKAIDIRNQYLAHAGITKFETSEPYAVLNPTHGPNMGTLIAVSHTRFTLPVHKTMMELVELVSFVEKAARKKSQKKVDLLTAHINEDPAKYEIPVSTVPKNSSKS